jgi:carboxylesterase
MQPLKALAENLVKAEVKCYPKGEEYLVQQKACLVVHGLTGTPANMASITEALKAKGYLVKAPLLAGHGVDLKTLANSTWRDWYGTVLRAYEELSKQAAKIYFVGSSLGALLGLKLAQEFGNPIKALALLGTPIQLKPLFKHLVIPGVRYTPLRLFIRSTAKNFEKSVLDPEGRELYRQNSLHRLPARAVFQTQDLAKEVTKELHKISQPLILIHGHKDHLADPKGLLEIKKKVVSKQVDIVMMEQSAHVVSVDYDREEVAKRVVDFFDSFSTARQTR